MGMTDGHVGITEYLRAGLKKDLPHPCRDIEAKDLAVPVFSYDDRAIAADSRTADTGGFRRYLLQARSIHIG